MKKTNKRPSFLAVALIPLVMMASLGHAQTPASSPAFTAPPPANPGPAAAPAPNDTDAIPLPPIPSTPSIAPAPAPTGPTSPLSPPPDQTVTVPAAAPASPVTNVRDGSGKFMETVIPVDLNSFAKAMARKAGYSYVANPLVTGQVDGTFINPDPLVDLRQAARANGYSLRVDPGTHAVELENAQTRAAAPTVLYTRRLKYLRAAYVRDPGMDEDISSTPPNGSGTGAPGGGSSGGSSSGGSSPSTVPGSQAERLEALFKPVLSDGAYLKYDIKTSTLIARDSDVNIANLNALIDQLDVDRPLIRVEVQALEVNADNIRNRGINWAGTLGDSAGLNLSLNTQDALLRVFTGGLNMGQFLNPTGNDSGSGAIFSVSDVAVTVKLLNEMNAIDSKARWFVDTEDNESGQTKVVVEQPIVQITDSTSTTTSQVQFNYVDVGNILRVTPQLRPDGLIRLQIHPELSNITGTVTAGQSSAPIIQERSTEAIVTCPINKVCILGGLQDLFHINANNKIPLLGDIPLLRWFFSSERDENQTRNLVLLVHPMVIDYDSPKYAEAIDTYIKSYEWRPEYGAANNKNIHSSTDPRWDAELAAPADVPVSRLSPPLPQTDRQTTPRTTDEE